MPLAGRQLPPRDKRVLGIKYYLTQDIDMHDIQFIMAS